MVGVCVSVSHVREPEKTAKPIGMPFGADSCGTFQWKKAKFRTQRIKNSQCNTLVASVLKAGSQRLRRNY